MSFAFFAGVRARAAFVSITILGASGAMACSSDRASESQRGDDTGSTGTIQRTDDSTMGSGGSLAANAIDLASTPSLNNHADGVTYVRLPAGITREQALHADAAIQAKIDQAVLAELSKRPSDVVVLTEASGIPILPDAERLRGEQHAMALSNNELTFTFNSPANPWDEFETEILRTQVPLVYSTLKSIYGNPFFNETINIRKGEVLPGTGGLFYPSTNEILLPSLSWNDLVLAHEMTHAFHDDFVLGPGAFEEGMATSLEVEIGNAAEFPVVERNHGLPIHVLYESHNRTPIGSKSGNFWAGYNPSLKYQMAGYAWSKAFIEVPSFFKTFNQNYYAAVTADAGVRINETKLLYLAAGAAPSVEAKEFTGWYRLQHVFSTVPPSGYQLVFDNLTSSKYLDFFYRDGSGYEAVQPNVPVQWSAYDANNKLLESGTAITNSAGGAYFNPFFTYSGRVKYVFQAPIPGGTMARTYFRAEGDLGGVFGINPLSNTGSVTITSLDNLVAPVTVPVVNGAFSAPTLRNVRGRFRAQYTNANGTNFTVYFNKDAYHYFVMLAMTLGGRVLTTAGVPVKGANMTLTSAGLPSSPTVTDEYGNYWFIHLEGGRNYSVTAAKTGYFIAPAMNTVFLSQNKVWVMFNTPGTP